MILIPITLYKLRKIHQFSRKLYNIIMGKNKRRQLLVEDTVHDVQLSVDSAEEVDCVNWLCEAVQLSIINDFTYQPLAFQLFDSVKYQDINNKTKTLFREHIYTADFCIMFSPSAQLILAKEFKVPYSSLSCNECSAYVDCKGTFNTQARSFGYNQKWTWQLFKTYIYKLVPKDFFKLFGVPQKSRLTEKTRKPRKMFLGFKSISETFGLK